MGLFGRKKQETVTTTPTVQLQGWMIECGPKCGFMIRTQDKKELVGYLVNHNKVAHKNPITAAQAEGDVKPATWTAPA